MHSLIKIILSNFTLTFFVIAIICSLVSIFRHKGELTRSRIVEAIFKYYCFWVQGICWIYNGMMHIIFHKMAAGFIGWADSPFQLEVGVASLGMGIVGLIAIKKNFGLRLALIINSSVFLWGAALGHIYQIMIADNHTAGNAGLMLWSDFLIPVISIILLSFSYATSKAEKLHYSYII